ncbi:hypothetical protein PDE_05093 [Penicillium oxalicum 114-2]|uniref:AT DNA binding protein n=1 Tax=Penicillium oxalicum (strain 114-2 / CGMCC 5302) TaxID=933388 RepID=S8AV81_PENO1|nr:hypothetical protein PDE_05093 [Penicillium oxalicum 114-2]
MSITSRSQSSSPDILGPPGDAEYLISSPIKPFTGRQSWLSPAVVKRQRTPAKRRRMTLSPTRSAHSIRFDDVLLPGSPAMKLDGYQKSLSPEKLLGQEGNVSPWRIRVTLEATQDGDDTGHSIASRKRPRPTTVTTMVPLKDEGSPMRPGTPATRRIRMRDSESQPQNGSPWPRSPGNTPGLLGATPKRRSGRPRKNTPRPQFQSTTILSNQQEAETSPVLEPTPRNYSPMDITTDVSANPNRTWSPMNLSADGDYESAPLTTNELSTEYVDISTTTNTHAQQDARPREYGRLSYDTPIISATEHHFLGDDEDIHSTPSKIPTPTRERLGSASLSSHLAGGTISPRTYPTPTPTSSLADEDTQTREQATDARDSPPPTDAVHERQEQPSMDPTDEHEEFDSIMESEGFTMVSLDTLPSAKQYGIGSSAKPNSDFGGAQDSGRIGDRLKRKLPGRIESLRGDGHTTKRPSPLSKAFTSRQISPKNDLLEVESATRRQQSSEVAYPVLPEMRATKKALGEAWSKPHISLPRIVRVGIALRGVFEPGEAGFPERQNASRKRRLENVFSSFDAHMQRELRAGLGFAQELAMRLGSTAENQPEAVDTSEDDMSLQGKDEQQYPYQAGQMGQRQDSLEWDDVSAEEDVQEEEIQSDNEPMIMPSVSQQFVSPQGQTAVARASREREWQREREQVRRQARDAMNSERLISIESDEAMAQEQPLGQFNGVEQRSGTPLSEQSFNEEPYNEHAEGLGEVPASSPVQPINHGVNPSIEGAAYEDESGDDDDIWRPEISHSKLSKAPISHTTQEQQPVIGEADFDDEDDDAGDIWQQEARDQSNISHHSDKQAQADTVQRSPALWQAADQRQSAHEDRSSSSPVYVNIEHRDGTHPVPTHIRKLRDQNVDLSALLADEETPNRARYYNGTSTPREMLNRRLAAPLQSAMKSASSARKTGQRVRLQPMPQSSPQIGSDAELSYSPAFKPNVPRQDQSREHTEGFDADFEPDGEETARDGPAAAATPRPVRHPNQSAEESTWFQRITSLTPRWLKAPDQDGDDSSSSIAASEDDPDSEFDQRDDRIGTANAESAQTLGKPADQLPLSDRSSQSPSRFLGDSASPPPKSLGDPTHPAKSSGPRAPTHDARGTSQGSEPRVAPESVHVKGDYGKGHSDEALHAESRQKRRSRPLPTFGYFSDEHYEALRRLYQLAKRAPERFPYHEAAGRVEIIGDWIWTSDGLHGVPITELQFAIIDRFVHDLSRADADYGGSGRVEWTEAELHRRLISIIIGEQIRENQKSKTTRAGSVDLWR